jgi:hypothetical protein
VNNDSGSGGRPVAGRLEANRQQHDGREPYRGPCSESRGEAGHHRQDDAEVPDRLSNADSARESARDASRASRLRLNESSGASQANDDERSSCGYTSGRFVWKP